MSRLNDLQIEFKDAKYQVTGISVQKNEATQGGLGGDGNVTESPTSD